ncbi:MAG: hypothetical protein GY841_07210, partial [FCB group bacterium]|nr:hypothetical protein [FCB group bacterium]
SIRPQHVESNAISATIARFILTELDRCGTLAQDIINLKNLHQIVDKRELTAIIEKVLVNHTREEQLTGKER